MSIANKDYEALQIRLNNDIILARRLANATRRILTVVSHVHASALLRILRNAERVEQQAAEARDQAEEFSRWANEQKQIARQALVEAVERVDITAQAVAAELDTLPALTPEARAVARGW